MIWMGFDALPTTVEITKTRNVDDQLGIFDGVSIHIFARRSSRDDSLMLLKELE